jgi:hypothetical protein
VTALERDFHIEQGADWPGEQFYIVDAVGNAKILAPPMIATGSIVDPISGVTLLTWSNSPTAGQAQIVFTGNLYIPTITADLTLPWTFRTARYQLYLYDPAAPVADQTIRVGQGTVYLSRKI